MFLNRVIVSIKSFGDFLIPISVLDNLNITDFTILTLPQNKELYEILNSTVTVEYLCMIKKTPAFFDIKNKGILNALNDFNKIKKEFILLKNQKKSFDFYIDNSDFRYSLLLSGFTRKSIYNENSNIYLDYLTCFSVDKTLSIYKNSKKIKKASIFPDSRLKSKQISSNDLESIKKLFNLMGISYNIYCYNDEISGNSYESFDELKSLILDSDLIVSADSLAAHLAFYLKIPVFTVLNRKNDYWLNPFSRQFNLYTFSNDFTSLYNYLECQ
jgi:ADP-heptose:LPS heptosyltransferase